MGSVSREHKYVIGLRGGSFLMLEVNHDFDVSDPPDIFAVWAWCGLTVGQDVKPHFNFSSLCCLKVIKLPEYWRVKGFDSFALPEIDVAEFEAAKAEIHKLVAEAKRKAESKIVVPRNGVPDFGGE